MADHAFISVYLQQHEKEVLDRAAARAGRTRNRFVRDWIGDLDEQHDNEAPDEDR